MIIGGAIGGAGGKSAAWGGTINLVSADAFMHSGGKCAFRFNYNMINLGPAATSPPFLNRIRAGSSVVTTQSNLALAGGATASINTEGYLVPGTQVITLSLDDAGDVKEANEGNNLWSVMVNLSGSCKK